ncbi:hypothetical protein [Silvibacterium acidisoli]|uniref:hypothetical protein n=1 Tax=Acidobacteriaceae bacterium ZG23-2 TaxID=2883246 RepID=UPI00406D0E9F
MIQLCRHIKPEGTQCSAAALRAGRFCHAHERLHTANGQVTSLPAVELLFPEDRVAIQTNLFRIADALAAGRIDLGTSNAMTYNMRAALSNLGQRPLLPASSPAGEGASPQPVARVILTPEGDRIAPPVEMLEPGESEPVHHRACPCLACAEKYRDWPGELHHADCACGLCEAISEPALIASGPRELTATPLRRATAATLLSSSAASDPLSRPWSVADYTFGDSIRRHEAQYAARAAAALAAGIEPPPYQPFDTGLLDPTSDEAAVERERQQSADHLWTAHFQALLEQRQAAAVAAPESRNENENDPEPPARPGQLAIVQAATTNRCPIQASPGWEVRSRTAKIGSPIAQLFLCHGPRGSATIAPATAADPMRKATGTHGDPYGPDLIQRRKRPRPCSGPLPIRSNHTGGAASSADTPDAGTTHDSAADRRGLSARPVLLCRSPHRRRTPAEVRRRDWRGGGPSHPQPHPAGSHRMQRVEVDRGDSGQPALRPHRAHRAPEAGDCLNIGLIHGRHPRCRQHVSAHRPLPGDPDRSLLGGKLHDDSHIERHQAGHHHGK